jgi:hypothetical protein
MNVKKNHDLPKDISITAICFLLGVNRQRVGQLEAAGVVERVAPGRYSIASVPRFIDMQRKAGGGSEAMQEAKLDLILQKITAGKLDIEEREGKLVPVDNALNAFSAVTAMVRQRILALPTKLAPRLLGKHHAGEIESILRVDIYEALEAIANDEDIRRIDFGK